MLRCLIPVGGTPAIESYLIVIAGVCAVIVLSGYCSNVSKFHITNIRFVL